MKRSCALVLLAAAAPDVTAGFTSCSTPEQFCELLKPGMVVFIGRPLSVIGERRGPATVTFAVLENLWGAAGERTVKIETWENWPSDGVQFLALMPNGERRYRYATCEPGVILPVDDPRVHQFRRDLKEGRPASAQVEVRSPDYSRIAGVDVELTRGAHVLRGRTQGGGLLNVGRIPPGEYRVGASKRNFIQPEGEVRTSLLPGSCAPLRIDLAPVSRISGRIVDARGEAVRGAIFHLMGWAERASLADSVYDAVVESVRSRVFRIMGWKRSSESNPVYRLSQTDGSGRFTISGVLPGRYYLVSDISAVYEPWGLPLPKTYYPGVFGWKNATRIVVEEGRSVENVWFQLPDYGPKRRVELQVVDATGRPVAGAWVDDARLDDHNERATNVRSSKVTGRDGRVTFDLWTVSDYRLNATAVYGSNTAWGTVDIPAGRSPFTGVVVVRARQ